MTIRPTDAPPAGPAAAVHGLARRRVAAAAVRDLAVRPGAQRRGAVARVTAAALRAAWASCSPPVDGVALAAVGSLARGDSGPASDLDLVLLHDERVDPVRVGELADALWYPLWDEGLRLDHSVRTPGQCRQVAAADLVAAVGLLDLTEIAGDPDLVAGARSALARDWRGQARTRLPELVDAVRERHARHGELADLLEPDLKEARGGLRDMTVVSALTAAWLTDRPRAGLDAAHGTLLDVRDALHFVTGRGRERLLAQDRDGVAAVLGHSCGDDLLRAVSEAGRVIADALETALRRSGQAQRARVLRVGPRRPLLTPLGHGLSTHDGEVVLGPRTDPRGDPLLALRAARAAARGDLPLAPATLARLVDDVPPLPRPWPSAARDLFTDLLAAGEGLVRTWESLTLAGIAEAWIPDWSGIRSRPQHHPWHRHTVDRHSVQTVVAAQALVADVRRPDLLLVAALLHDIGKARGTTDHDRLGAPTARAIALALGLDSVDAAVVGRLVERHLFLVDLATRRDPSDPHTVALVEEAVDGDPDVLDLLRALTEADARAAGPGAWTTWRARLVDELTGSARAALRRTPTAAPEQAEPLDVPPHVRSAAVASGAYVAVEELGSGHLVEVVAPDRVGLFADTAGVLAASGATVRRAHLATFDGLAVDRWHVESPHGHVLEADALQRALLRLARGDRRGLASLARRDRAAAAKPGGARAFLVSGADDDATIVELRAPDRPGLLFDVGRAVAAAGVNVRSAHVSTYGGQAVDTVYVTSSEGGALPPADVARLLDVVMRAADGDLAPVDVDA